MRYAISAKTIIPTTTARSVKMPYRLSKVTWVLEIAIFWVSGFFPSGLFVLKRYALTVLLTLFRVSLWDIDKGPVPVLLVLAFKSVWQSYAPPMEVLGPLELLRRMVNESIRVGLANNVFSLRKLSLLSYN
jgi:hypothetical protein